MFAPFCPLEDGLSRSERSLKISSGICTGRAGCCCRRATSLSSRNGLVDIGRSGCLTAGGVPAVEEL